MSDKIETRKPGADGWLELEGGIRISLLGIEYADPPFFERCVVAWREIGELRLQVLPSTSSCGIFAIPIAGSQCVGQPRFIATFADPEIGRAVFRRLRAAWLKRTRIDVGGAK